MTSQVLLTGAAGRLGLRIGTCAAEPPDHRAFATWLSPDDLVGGPFTTQEYRIDEVATRE
jgi:hypothetical protein